MNKIHFLLDKDNYYFGSITKENNNVIQIKFDTIPDENILISGFEILNEHNNFSMTGDYYYGYNTIYNIIDDNTVLLSNDGSIYIPSEESNDFNDSVQDVELTDEEKSAIEKQNQIYEIQNKISILKNELNESDYVIVKCQEYLLAGKELPNEYDIESYSEKRDNIRLQINELEMQLQILSE